MWQEVTRNTGVNLYKLRDYEEQLAEGQRGRLDLYLKTPLSEGMQGILQSRLEQAGVQEVSVTSSNPLHITFRKGIAWLAIIVVAILALAILVVSWRFFKEVVETFPTPVLVGGAVAGIAIVIAIAVVLILGTARGGT